MFHADYQKRFLIISVLFSLLMFTALWITSTTPLASLKILSGTFILIVAFLSTEIALYLVIFSMLISPEIVIAETAVREVTVRFEDILLPIIGMTWLARVALHKELGLVLITPCSSLVSFLLMSC